MSVRHAKAGAPRAPRVPAAFGGDAGLYAEFLAESRAVLPADLAAGDAALAAADLARLRHLGHDLRTLLATLGRPRAAAIAARLDEAAAAGQAVQAAAAWRALRRALRRWLAVHG